MKYGGDQVCEAFAYACRRFNNEVGLGVERLGDRLCHLELLWAEFVVGQRAESSVFREYRVDVTSDVLHVMIIAKKEQRVKVMKGVVREYAA